MFSRNLYILLRQASSVHDCLVSLVSQVVVPFNYPEFTTRRVFVSEWIDGEKLSQSKADDVQDLVNVGVTACQYLGYCLYCF